MRPVAGRSASLTDPAWIYELKLDGFRLLADVRRREVMLRYRSGIECSHVFDVLAVGDLDVRPVPLVDRKMLVERVVERSTGALRAVPFVLGDGRELAAFVMKHGLEGIVAKRASSPYVGGDSPSWIKIKRWEEEEFILARVHRDREGEVDAVEIATRERGELMAAGIVELGLWRLEGVLDRAGRRGWAEAPADLVVTITFTGRTSAGSLRAAVIKGIRSST